MSFFIELIVGFQNKIETMRRDLSHGLFTFHKGADKFRLRANPYEKRRAARIPFKMN